MSCPCNNRFDSKQSYPKRVFQEKENLPKSSIPKNLCNIKKDCINQKLNDKEYLDEFLRKFSINNEYNPDTGITKTHGIPSAYIDWCPKDTKKEQVFNNNPYIKWEIKSGYLIVRDYRIKGDKDLCFEDGGQIILKRNFSIPLCALPEGYPASWLTGLSDELANFFDSETIQRDSKTNKFTVKKENKAALKFYSDKDKTKLVFQYDQEGDFYYLVDGSLDNKVAVKTDNATIKGNGKDIPLQKK